MQNYDEWKLETPPLYNKRDTQIEKCDKCGGDVYWYDRGECRGNKLIHIGFFSEDNKQKAIPLKQIFKIGDCEIEL